MSDTDAAVKFSIKNEGEVIAVNTNIDSSSYPKQIIKPPLSDLSQWQMQARNQILFSTQPGKNSEQIRNIVKTFGKVLFSQNEEIQTVIKHKLRTAPSNSTIAFEIMFLDRETTVYPWEACAFLWEELGIERDGRRIAIVRTPTIPKQKWRMFEPIKILVAGSSPVDGVTTTNIQKEYSTIKKALNSFLYNELFKLPDPISELTIHKLGLEVKKFQPNVVHLVTHGEPNILELETPEGFRVRVKPDELTKALNEAGENLLLFVSTACFAIQDNPEQDEWGLGQALSQNVPLSIGMQLPIKSQHALEFTKEFYSVLARSKSVLEAFVSARDILYKNEPFSPACIAPVLYRGVFDYENVRLFSYQDMPNFIEESTKALWDQIDTMRGDSRNVNALIEVIRIINNIDKNIIDYRLDKKPFPFTSNQKGYFRKMGDAISIARAKASRMQRLIEAKELRYEFEYLDDDSRVLIENLRTICLELAGLLETFSNKEL